MPVPAALDINSVGLTDLLDLIAIVLALFIFLIIFFTRR